MKQAKAVKPMKNDMAGPICIRLPKDLDKTLKKVSRHTGLSMSAVIRLTLRESYPLKEEA